MCVPLVFLAVHAAPHTLHFAPQSSRILLSRGSGFEAFRGVAQRLR